MLGVGRTTSCIQGFFGPTCCMEAIIHCKKLLLIYSKSDCEYTVLIAVGKCTAMSSVK